VLHQPVDPEAEDRADGLQHEEAPRTSCTLLWHPALFVGLLQADKHSPWSAVRNAAHAYDFVAAIIAERERRANLASAQSFRSRAYGDIGLARSQTGAGLAEVAKKRAELQKSLEERSAIKR
jgi:hypothetical protein